MTNHTALMWRIERIDDVILGFTNHDQDIEFEGTIYASKGAMEASTIERELGLAGDNLELLGGVHGDCISEVDIDRGLFDHAVVTQFSFDWKHKKKMCDQFDGKIVKINCSETHFRCDVDWGFSDLSRSFGRTYQQTCSASFCGRECGLSRDAFSIPASITSYTEKILKLDKNIDVSFVKHGIVVFEGRARKISEYAIQNVEQTDGETRLRLRQSLPFEPDLNEEILVVQGCDKSMARCASLGNSENFRGFPHMPGQKVMKAIENEYSIR